MEAALIVLATAVLACAIAIIVLVVGGLQKDQELARLQLAQTELMLELQKAKAEMATARVVAGADQVAQQASDASDQQLVEQLDSELQGEGT